MNLASPLGELGGLLTLLASRGAEATLEHSHSTLFPYWNALVKPPSLPEDRYLLTKVRCARFLAIGEPVPGATPSALPESGLRHSTAPESRPHVVSRLDRKSVV